MFTAKFDLGVEDSVFEATLRGAEVTNIPIRARNKMIFAAFMIKIYYNFKKDLLYLNCVGHKKNQLKNKRC